MNLKKIEESIESYKLYLSQLTEEYPQSFKWECLKNYKDRWNEESADMEMMYRQSFKSQISVSLWGGSRNSPKSAMLQMIKTNPDYARIMFRDLFDERKELHMRMDRFSFHCDQLMEEVQKTDSKFSQHRHDNYRIISLYLCFNDPENYCIYNYKAFKKYMEFLEVQKLPEEFEVNRFFKVCKTLASFLAKDEELLQMHQELIKEEYFYKGAAPMLMVHDLYHQPKIKIETE